MKFAIFLTLAVAIYVVSCVDPNIDEEESKARSFIQHLNEKDGVRKNLGSLAAWDYASNITDFNLKKELALSAKHAKETKEDWQETIKFNWKTYKDADLKRQFWKYSMLGNAALPTDKYEKLDQVIAEMQKTYATSKICDFKDSKKCDLNYEPELVNIMAKSRDAEELKHVWIEWRKATGVTRENYKEYVTLLNEAARLNNFTDNSEMWLVNYESKEFRQQLTILWEQMKPLYLQIHAYVRQQLRNKYGDIVSEKGPIPAHLLGNMWAQTWDHIAEFTRPYPNKKSEYVTEEMIKQNFTAEKMFKLSEEFFVSLNMTPMTNTFWEKSILEKPKDGRELVCHASAWDFYNGDDFRIKQCTRVNAEDLSTAHHEMGHIQYDQQYQHQPVVFREGANPGFHEAVGDVMSLSVSTRKHLRKIGLLKSTEDDEEMAINSLYEAAMGKIVFPPFAYLMDLWRWDVFSGKISSEDYNCRWWQLRQDIQGVEPPVDRTEDDFDPAAKYHIVASVPYIRYFVSYVVQFQFQRTLCEIAGEYVPNDPTKQLHNCDIFGSVKAGNAMKKMLQLGSSVPWPTAMEVLTGQRNMDASGILEYFKPLQQWLEVENKKSGAFIGWEASKRACVKVKKEVSHST